jgi:hypothetical protein
MVKATVHHHAGHVRTVEYQDAVVPDAERVSDLVVDLPGNGLDDSVIQVRAEGPPASVSFDILASGEKEVPMNFPFWRKRVEQLKREHFGRDLSFFPCRDCGDVISFIL